MRLRCARRQTSSGASVVNLDDLYREILLDHYRRPRNRGPLETANASAEGSNPLCGDEITLELQLDDDGRIADVAFTGDGCSISQASSSLMTEYVRGRKSDEATSAIDAFQAMMIEGEEAPEELGDIGALAGVRKFPMRVKCASLAWKTLELALAQHDRHDDAPRATVTTDERSTSNG